MALGDYTAAQVLAALEAAWSDQGAHEARHNDFDTSTTPTVVAAQKFMREHGNGFRELAAATFLKAIETGEETKMGVRGRILDGHPSLYFEAMMSAAHAVAGWTSQLIFDAVDRLEASDELRRIAGVPSGPDEEVNR